MPKITVHGGPSNKYQTSATVTPSTATASVLPASEVEEAGAPADLVELVLAAVEEPVPAERLRVSPAARPRKATRPQATDGDA